MQIYRWNRQGHVSFISFASWRTRFLDKASVVNQLPSARFLSARLSKHTCIIGTFGLVCLNPIVREKSIESFATTGAHDYHIHVRETIFVFGWAHGRRREGGTWPPSILKLFFSYSFGVEIFFFWQFCVGKLEFHHGCPVSEKMPLVTTWKNPLLPPPGKKLSNANGRAEN